MFDIGWGEFVVIGVVALIAIGPKELPGVLRSIGQWTGKIRRMASDFQGQFQEAMREAEMSDIKKQVDELSSTASSYTSFDPLGDAQKQIDSIVSETNLDASSTAEANTPTADPTGVASETVPPIDVPPIEAVVAAAGKPDAGSEQAAQNPPVVSGEGRSA